MRATVYAAVCGLWLLIAENLGYAQLSSRNFMVTERDFVMTQRDAAKYSDEVVSPIVFDFAEDRSGLEALRTRIQNMLDMIHRKEIDYIALPAYYPIRKLGVIAKLERFGSKPTVIAFIPEVRDWQSTMSAEEFKYGLLTTFAHEMIHLELGHHERTEASDQAVAKDEGEAWAKTIVEIIRPLQAKGLPTAPYFAELANCFHRLSDDSSNPKWAQLFMFR